jgi:menaquinone-9 beta-reductase
MNTDQKTFKVIIIGGGPAGMATALHLTQRNPALLDEMIILEREAHPRMKLCGGAVTFHGVEQLGALDIQVQAPAFQVDQLTFRLGRLSFTVPHTDAMRIYEREAFDAALAQVVRARGVQLREDHRVLGLSPTPDGYEVHTNQGTYCAGVIIAADGANSTVRHKLKLASTMGIARLLRVLTPIVTPSDTPLWTAREAVFDFTPVLHGIQGYMWDFPCYKGGVPTMNYGIFDSRFEPVPASEREHGHFKRVFADELIARDVDPNGVTLRGHPVRWFHPANEFSRSRLLLVGDAAGVDPLFAEGISFALQYGQIAAEAVLQAQRTGDYSFNSYRADLLAHPMGRLLARRTWVADHLYGHRFPWAWRWLWRAASVSPRRVQQQIGHALAVLPPVGG